MKQQKPLLALFLTLVIAFSFIAVIQIQKDNPLTFNPTAPLAANLPPKEQAVLWITPALSNQPVINDVKEAQISLISNSTRTEVYNFIAANPGIQFRGICAGLSIAIGTAEFHLGILKKAGLISFFRDGKYKRFFVNKKFSAKEIKLISLLRHETTRQILKAIAAEKTVSHSKLASDLCITSQGLTWQMNRLREDGVIQENYDGLKVSYSINEVNAHALTELLFLVEH